MSLTLLSRAGIWSATLIVAAVAAVARSLAHVTPDVAWLLYATERWLGGARLGVEIMDASPPVILWLKAPVVLLAQILGVTLWQAWVGFVTLLTLASIGAGARVLARSPAPGNSAATCWFPLLAVAVLLVLPRHDFGQREHVAVILVLPWILLTGVRAASGPVVSSGLTIALSVAAGLGMSIKPHFGLLWLVMVGFQWRRRGGSVVRLAARPEIAGSALTGAACVAAVVLLAPGWLESARSYWPLYASFIPGNPLLTAVAEPRALASLFLMLAWLGLRRQAGSDGRVGLVLILAAATFHVIAASQGKAFPYHFLPALAFGALAVGSAWSGLTRPLAGIARPVVASAGIAAVVALIGQGIYDTGLLLSGRTPPRHELDPWGDQLREVITTAGDSRTVMAFSTAIQSGFPLVLETRGTWTGRHSALWMFAALYEDQLFRGRIVAPRPPAERPPLERKVLDELHEDFLARPPDALLVVKQDSLFRGWAGAPQFDYVRYLTAEPRFRELLAPYREAGEVGLYRVMWRTEGPADEGAEARVREAIARQGPPLPEWQRPIWPLVLLLLVLNLALAGELRIAAGTGRRTPRQAGPA